MIPVVRGNVARGWPGLEGHLRYHKVLLAFERLDPHWVTARYPGDEMVRCVVASHARLKGCCNRCQFIPSSFPIIQEVLLRVAFKTETQGFLPQNRSSSKEQTNHPRRGQTKTPSIKQRMGDLSDS